MKNHGYFGKILWVDLSKESFREESLSEDHYRQYLGGYGLATKLLYENMPAKTDPLGPEAIFGFFPGLLTGGIAPLTGRYMVAGKSPLTGTWGNANSGGYFGAEIKKCGYDAILIKGMSEIPKYIAILDGEKQIIDASSLWGLDTVQTENNLIEKHGNVKIASIGQSGENLSLISGIVNDKGRIAGRSGFGAVMGSKKLKAVVLKGNKEISVANKEDLNKFTRDFNNAINTSTSADLQSWKMLGTTAFNIASAEVGDSPIKNWGGNVKDDFPDDKLKKLSGVEIVKYNQKPFGCFTCPVRCGAISKVPEAGIEESHRPEYETCASFGHLLLNDDVVSIFILNDLCNRASLDTISAGGTVAFAIECYENGILSKTDTNGLELTWGNSTVIIELVKKIINREGLGNILADGCKIASEKIGKGSEKYAIHSGGQELGMHSPKIYKHLGASYAFDPTPGRHTSACLDVAIEGPMLEPNGLFEGFQLPKNYEIPGKDRYEAEKLVTGIWQCMESLGLCQFIIYFLKYPLIPLIKAIVGWDLTIDDLVKIGTRIQTLRQAFTLREGVDIVNNRLPERAIGVDYLTDHKGYCEKMGWNPSNGKPLKETLKKLDLDFVVKDLY